MKRAFMVLAVALALAGCAGGFGVRTTLGNDVESGCIESKAAFDGHRLACVAISCPAGEMQQATAVRNEAAAFCAKSPPSTPANIAKIKGLVAKQWVIGRRR